MIQKHSKYSEQVMHGSLGLDPYPHLCETDTCSDGYGFRTGTSHQTQAYAPSDPYPRTRAGFEVVGAVLRFFAVK